MLYREVLKNGDKLSVLGYGCMRLPARMGSINEKLAEKQILYAFDQGVNYFDTAVPFPIPDLLEDVKNPDQRSGLLPKKKPTRLGGA